MKIGIMGTGAVGAFFGSLLSSAGHEVTFIARGSSLEKMTENGLHVYKDEELIVVSEHFTDDVKELSNAELVLFCVKSGDTEEAAQQINAACGPDTFILTLQNGVSNEEVLVSVFGEERVFSAATYVQAKSVSPGIFRQNGFYQLVIGGLGSDSESKSQLFTQVFEQANIPAKTVSDILRNKWKKYIWNVTFNPLSAVANASVGDMLGSPHLRKLAEGIGNEVLAVANKLGYSFPQEFLENLFITSERAKDHQTSMLQDLKNGKKLETDALTGYLIRKAEKTNVQVPLTNTIHGLLKFAEEQQRK
ncbi:ketopantoate reductase family protein [Mesobacillus harenae]|uniref:ketopantoate reductase family protein n=1 Tax=Mesobacillus harenae TaxID=2213203 RepID=UPI0015811C7D|nr:2-dehydropantoate 2-reductase [Mesobacillus harenae]